MTNNIKLLKHFIKVVKKTQRILRYIKWHFSYITKKLYLVCTTLWLFYIWIMLSIFSANFWEKNAVKIK